MCALFYHFSDDSVFRMTELSVHAKRPAAASGLKSAAWDLSAAREIVARPTLGRVSKRKRQPVRKIAANHMSGPARDPVAGYLNTEHASARSF